MKITINLHNIICYGIIILLAWLAFRNTSPNNNAEIDRVKFERDSIIAAVIDQSKVEADSYHRLADSCRNAIKVYEKADSINHYKSRYERGKIKKYTPNERDHVRDSIYRANGVQTSPR